MDLIQELQSRSQELSTSIKLLRENGQKLAQTEYAYKIEMSKEVLRMKEAGQSATMINMIIYGQKSVADLRLRRDIAQVMYDANKEHINVTKVLIRVLETQIKLEYGDED